MDESTVIYITKFIEAFNKSKFNNMQGFNKIKCYIIDHGYITMDKISELFPTKNGSAVGYRGDIITNYAWTQFECINDNYNHVVKSGCVYYDKLNDNIILTLPIKIKENKMNKEYAIDQLNTIINSNPDNDAEGTQDTTTVRVTDENYEYTIVRKDKVKYLPLSSIKPHKEYKVIPGQTAWEKWHNVSFSYVMKINPLMSMITLFTLFPREKYSYEARSKLYDDLSFNLKYPGINKVLLVFIGKDSSNKDVLEVMIIDQDSSFFDGKRVIVKGE